MLAVVDSDVRPASLEQVPLWFEEWEKSLSRFRQDSELCQFNRLAGRPIFVSEVLWDVMQVSAEAGKLTSGLVNPLILNALVNAGYNQSFENLQDDPLASFSDSADVPGLGEILTDPKVRTICIPEGAQLDFGGVAKGWAAHRATELLKINGPSLVDAGGDIAVSGPDSHGDAWPIGIDDPFNPGTNFEIIYLEIGGVATSGRDYRHWTHQGTPQHHIIDPGTGLPAATDILTATVIAPTVMQAEAVAKSVLISGSQHGLAWLDAHEDWAGVLVLEDGRGLYTRSADSYL